MKPYYNNYKPRNPQSFRVKPRFNSKSRKTVWRRSRLLFKLSHVWRDSINRVRFYPFLYKKFYVGRAWSKNEKFFRFSINTTRNKFFSKRNWWVPFRRRVYRKYFKKILPKRKKIVLKYFWKKKILTNRKKFKKKIFV